MSAVVSKRGWMGLVLLLAGCSSVEPEDQADALATGKTVQALESAALVSSDRYCSTGIPDQTGSVCCASTCQSIAGDTLFACDQGTDQGTTCADRGPDELCCPDEIREAKKSCSDNPPPCVIKPDPECRTGIKDQAGQVCCPKFCGTCGGADCSQRTGSGANCCGGAIMSAGIMCSGGSPPCVLDGTTGDPEDVFDAPRTFRHPGLLNTQAGFDAIRAQSTQAIRNATLEIRDDSAGTFNYVHAPYRVVKVSHGTTSDNSKARWRADVRAAVANSLRWIAEGDNRHAVRARDILTDWALTLDRVEANDPNDADDVAQVALDAAWQAPFFAHAAETIRYHRDAVGWNSANRRKFEDMLKYLALTAKGVLYKRNNQGPSGALALMAVGVYTNDTDMYNMGRAAWQYLAPRLIYSQGMIDEAIYRDCVHPQYTLLALGQGAEIEYHQGSEAFYLLTKSGESKPQLLQAAEFLSHLFLGGAFPTSCTKNGQTKRGGIFDGACYWYPSDYRGTHTSCATDTIYAGYEVLYNHYRWVMGFEPDSEAGGNMDEFEDFVRGRRPDGDMYFVTGYSTLTHGDLGDP